jgi:hypothetical protein
MAGRNMEDSNFDPEFNWSPEDTIEMAFGDVVLQLRWNNTAVYKYTISEGRYDHIEHCADDGETYQFFLDDPDLRDDLERRGYPYTVSPFAEQALVNARIQYDIDVQTHEFATELDGITGIPEDLDK